MNMKPFIASGVLAFALGAVQAPADILLTDDFTVSANVNDPNFELGLGRQGGSLAAPTLSYVERFAGPGNQEQVGNSTTFTGNFNALLLAFGGGVYLDYDFSAVAAPLEISFDRVLSNGASANDNDWVSLNILGNTGQDNFVTAADFGILFRANGGTELFDHGANTAGISGTNTGFDVFAPYRVVLSDSAGTGSAFGSGGSLVSYYEGSTLLDSVSVGQLTGGYIGLGANSIGGIDNLQISSIPEPGSLSLMALAAGLLVLCRRRG